MINSRLGQSLCPSAIVIGTNQRLRMVICTTLETDDSGLEETIQPIYSGHVNDVQFSVQLNEVYCNFGDHHHTFQTKLTNIVVH